MKHRRLATLLTAGAIMLAGLAMAGPASANEGGDGHHGCRNVVNTIIGTSGPDFLVGTRCTDYIYGLGDNDRLVGNARPDFLFGGKGRDKLRGVDGWPDTLNGGRGRDRCTGDQFDNFKNCEVVLRFTVQPQSRLVHR